MILETNSDMKSVHLAVTVVLVCGSKGKVALKCTGQDSVLNDFALRVMLLLIEECGFVLFGCFFISTKQVIKINLSFAFVQWLH